MTERNNDVEAFASGLDWPQIRDIFNQRLEEGEKALKLQREADDQRISDQEKLLVAKIEAADEKLGVRIEALKELTRQYQEEQKYALEIANDEREKSAVALREEVNKAAQGLRENVSREIQAGDENLRQHIDHQAQQVATSFAASKEAITKAEVATEKRFESGDRTEARLQEEMKQLLPRELFNSTAIELRERGTTNLELIQALALRITQIEARGGGEKDHAADLKSTLAIGVAIVAVIAATAIGLMSMFVI